MIIHGLVLFIYKTLSRISVLMAALNVVHYLDNVFTNYLWTLKSSVIFSLTQPVISKG